MIAFQVTEDSLAPMAAEARDLLDRVDLVIEHLGTPTDHDLVPLLGKLRVCPGEALETLLNTPPDPLLDAAAGLRRLAAAYRDDLIAPLQRSAADLGWGGVGFEAFAQHWAVQARHVAAEDGPSMAAKLVLTADFAESVAGWFSQVRHAMAATLAEVLSSAEAVTLKGCGLLGGDPARLLKAVVTGELDHPGRLVTAAANVAAATLSVVEHWYDVAAEAFVAGPDGVPSFDWAGWMAALGDPPAAPRSGVAADPSAGWVRL